MWWVARAKATAARGLGSRALEADSFQTLACWWLSVVTLVGIGLNSALGWWWAEPLAALGVAALMGAADSDVALMTEVSTGFRLQWP